MTPQELQKLRNALSLATQALVDVLDSIDGDPDLETADLSDDECNGDLEPSLSGMGRYQGGKLEYDLEHDTSDTEFSLGWTNKLDQTNLGVSFDDLELQHDNQMETHY